MKKLFSLLTLALLTLSVGATSYTVEFDYSAEKTEPAFTSETEFITSGAEYISSFSTTGSVYGRNETNMSEPCIKIGKSSGPGSLTLNLATAVKPTSISINARAYNGTKAVTISLNDNVVANAITSTEFTDYALTMDGNTEVSAITISSDKYCYVKSMTVTYEDATPVTELQNPVFNPNGGEFDVTSLAVTVSCPTENASIYLYKVVDGEVDYTTQQYFFQSGEFYVTETSTYAAYAYKGNDYTDFVYATFTKVDPVTEVAEPTFDPADGYEFEESLDVTITGPEGSNIIYTLNDDDEVETPSPAVVHLTETSTIMAYAKIDGVESDIVEATYTKKEVTPLDPWQGTETYLASRDKGDFGGSAGAFNVFKEDRPGINLAFSNGTIAQDAYRIYKSSTITFTSEVGNITAIEFIGVAGNPVSNFGEVEGMTYDGNNGTWIGEAATVSFKAVTAQVRCTEIRVTVGQEAVIVAAPVITPENNTVFAGEQEVTITCSTEGALIYYTIGEGDETLYEGPFNIDASCTIKAYAKVGDAKSPEVSAKYYLGTEISTITEGNTVGQYYIYNGEAVVTYQNGSYTWIRDNSGSGLIYGYQVPKLSQGIVLKDGWTANYTVYKNVPEFQYPMGVEASEDSVAVAPYVRETVTTANVNEYVVLKGITVLTDESNTKKFYNAADSLVLYNQFNIADSVLNIENGKTYDVEGIVYIFNETTLELYITNVTEVTAQEWALGDVNHDTFVNVADVTALIKYVLTSGDEPEEFYAEQANVDGDAAGVLNVADVTALIQLVLNQ